MGISRERRVFALLNTAVKFLVAPDHRILGCHIVGYQASVLFHAILSIMKWRNDIIYIHPSLAEVIRGAARTAAGMLPIACRV